MSEKVDLKNIEILEPQPTELNPYEIDGYPYGFRLRTKARYYVETSKTYGQRQVFQTLNPKTQPPRWNKPKKGTYSDIVILYKDTTNGHIHAYYFGAAYTNEEDLKKFLEFCPIEKLSEHQKNKLKQIEAVYKVRKHFKYEVAVNPTKEQQAEIDKHKKKAQELMPLLMHYYMKNPEETPEKVNERGALLGGEKEQ
jgi:hypothetical protein